MPSPSPQGLPGDPHRTRRETVLSDPDGSFKCFQLKWAPPDANLTGSPAHVVQRSPVVPGLSGDSLPMLHNDLAIGPFNPSDKTFHGLLEI